MVRETKRFKIDLQPMRRKQNTHYSNHLAEYLGQNIKTWASWNRLPITITDTTTAKMVVISKADWYNWQELIKLYRHL